MGFKRGLSVRTGGWRVRTDSASDPEPADLLEELDGTDMRRLGEHLALHETGRGDRWTWLARRLVQEELIRESNDGIQRLHLRESGRRFLDEPWPLDFAA